jgi:hypothetical protein
MFHSQVGAARRPTLWGALVAVTMAVLLPSTVLGATGDLTFSRLSGLSSASDEWTAVSSQGTAVYTGGNNWSHAVLRRYSRTGQTIWTRAIPLKTAAGMAAGILGVAADSSGVYVAGFDGNRAGESAHEVGRAFVARYGFNGILNWFQYLDIDGATEATAIATYGSYVYVTGTVRDEPVTATGFPKAGFVRKLTRDGVNVWTQLIPSHEGQSQWQRPSGVAASSAGVYVSGTMTAVAGSTGPLYPVFMRLYSQEGKLMWSDYREIAQVNSSWGVAADATGAYAVAISTEGLYPYGAFLLKYDASGFLWRRRITESSDSNVHGVAVASSGVWIIGNTTRRLNNQPPGTVADPHGDMFVVRYSRSGAPLLERQYSDPAYQLGFAIDADAQGAYLAGKASGFGPSSSTGFWDGLLLAVEAP